MDTKRCAKCKLYLPFINFTKAPRMLLGYSSWCKNCYNEYNSLNNRRRNYSKLTKFRAIELLGGKCVCCGISDIEFLTFDHINNDGKIDRAQRSNQQIMLAVIRGERNDIQVLCWNCNCARYYCGVCPHQL